MTPFPETEIMTIKRLEVALRKMDFKLLKDGAYKLHEKYHSGYKFEYLDLIKEIYENIKDNYSIPEETKEILIPTIEDILANNGSKNAYGNTAPERVSSLTSLSYNSSNDNNQNTETTVAETPKIDAFNAFGTKPSTIHHYQESPIRNNSGFTQISAPVYNHSVVEENHVQEHIEEEKKEEVQENIATHVYEEVKEDLNQNEEIASAFDTPLQGTAINSNKTKTISFFYGQDNSKEKANNILKYRELISKMDNEHFSITEILNLLSEINTQSNTNVVELKNIFERLNLTENKINLITNSSSAALVNFFEENNFSYTLFNGNENAKTNLMPIFGLSNLFVCKNCSYEYLDKKEDIVPLVLECPKCKKPMFPNFYPTNDRNTELNIEYYNNALLSLANSSTWLIMHPVQNEIITNNLLISALKLSKNVEEIFILDKDINVRENYKNMFMEINENVKVNTQINAIEDFINLVR